MRMALRHRVWARMHALIRAGGNRFLRDVRGVVHVGANSGQEAALYRSHGLRVVWVEPIPEIFDQLTVNIAAMAGQRAYQALITERDGERHALRVATNGGASSSILDLKLHRDIWPEVAFDRTIEVEGVSLPSFLTAHRINVQDHDALVLDTQGSELMILRGAARILPAFRYIKVEAPDFEAYEGCCQVVDVERYLSHVGFRRIGKIPFARHPSGGWYYDLLYHRVR